MDTLCAQLLLPFSGDSFEALQVLLSWHADVQVFYIILSLISVVGFFHSVNLDMF